ncbi:hypothetical protein FPZ12_037545 [Amycolatopsis acidicola]|uniref:Uncharacterized protein n=1 Tax=Amycolatopsis acidicola TaxID=2596893 RepID=A0A5N0US00_9PSEU|nr:hypothetical protein FPZ12_037545 [Amycolatopsis acidicola]
MNLPMQAAPVHRAGPAAHAAEAGVEADWGFDDILGGITKVADTVSKVAPYVGPIATTLGSLI